MERTNERANQLRKACCAYDVILLLCIAALSGAGILVLHASTGVNAQPVIALPALMAACVYRIASSICPPRMPVADALNGYTSTTAGKVIAWFASLTLALQCGLIMSAVSAGWSSYFRSFLHSYGLLLPTTLAAASHSKMSSMTVNAPALCVTLAITLSLACGTRRPAKANAILTMIKVGVVLLFITAGGRHVVRANWQPYAPAGVAETLHITTIAFFAFIGFDAVTTAAEGLRSRTRSLAVTLGRPLAICVGAYVAVAPVMTGILPLRQFAARDMTPALNYAGKAWLTSLADAGTLLGMATVIMAASYLQARIVISMSEVRLFPKSWANTQSNSNRPFFATLLLGMASAAAAAFVPLSMLSELMNAGALIAYCSATVAVSVSAANH